MFGNVFDVSDRHRFSLPDISVLRRVGEKHVSRLLSTLTTELHIKSIVAGSKKLGLVETHRGGCQSNIFLRSFQLNVIPDRRLVQGDVQN